MPDTTNEVFFGPNRGPVWGILVLFLAIFVLTFLVGILRSFFMRRASLKADWRIAEEKVRERGLSDEDWRTLVSIIRRFAARTPRDVVFDRRVFNECADAYMNELLREGSSRLYREAGKKLREIREQLGLVESLAGRRFDTTRDLTVGQTIWFSPIPAEQPKWLRSYVVAADEAYFHLALSEAPNQVPPGLAAGDHVQCRFWHENEARYVFTATVVSVDDEAVRSSLAKGLDSEQGNRHKTVHTWSFFHVSKLERVQVRAFYRVPFTELGSLRVLSAPEDGDAEGAYVDRTVIEGRFVNVSAGGFAMATRQYVRQGVRVRMTLSLPGEVPFDVDAMVLSVEEVSSGIRLVRGRFIRIMEEEQDALVRFAIHRQQLTVDKEGA